MLVNSVQWNHLVRRVVYVNESEQLKRTLEYLKSEFYDIGNEWLEIEEYPHATTPIFIG